MRGHSHGRFFDGRTAVPHPVTLGVLGDGLQIYGQRARAFGFWSFDGMRPVQGARRDEPLQVMHRETPDARLVIEDAAVLAQLRDLAPKVFPRPISRHNIFQKLGMIGAVCAIIAVIVLVLVPQTAHVATRMVPLDWEVAWGQSLKTQLTRNEAVCTADDGRREFERLTQRLLATAPARDSGYPFSFTVIRVDQQNAFATMGGQIVVFSKLIEEMDGPDELAGVLAHEIAHVIARHPLTHTIEALTTQTFAGMFGGGASDAGRGAAGVGGMLVLSAYSRSMETEADRIAERILREARISPKGLADFFKRLERQSRSGGGALSLFASHPAMAERAARIADIDTAGTSPALSPQQWRTLRQICRTTTGKPHRPGK